MKIKQLREKECFDWIAEHNPISSCLDIPLKGKYKIQKFHCFSLWEVPVTQQCIESYPYKCYCPCEKWKYKEVSPSRYWATPQCHPWQRTVQQGSRECSERTARQAKTKTYPQSWPQSDGKRQKEDSKQNKNKDVRMCWKKKKRQQNINGISNKETLWKEIMNNKAKKKTRERLWGMMWLNASVRWVTSRPHIKTIKIDWWF